MFFRGNVLADIVFLIGGHVKLLILEVEVVSLSAITYE